MLAFDEWERIVTDAQKGDKEALKLLLKESKQIVIKEFAKMREGYNRPSMFTHELEDILQEVLSKVIKSLHKIRTPRAYLSWLTELTKNLCLNKFKDIERVRRLAAIGGQEEAENSHKNRLEDMRGFETKSTLKNIEQTLIDENYELHVLSAVTKFKEQMIDVKIPKFHGVPLEGHNYKNFEVYLTILSQASVDQEEGSYSDAEKKLKAIIAIAEKKRLNIELRYILGRAYFELAHLNMNRGLINGPEGSIASYGKASGFFKALKDKPSHIYTSQEIGVSHYINNQPGVAVGIYESILKEVPKSNVFKEIKANILRDLGNAQLALKQIGDSEKSTEKSLSLAEDIGGICLEYTALQKAKIYFARKRYDKTYEWIFKSLEGVPRHRVLDYVKAYILLFDYYMTIDEKLEALELVPFIKEKCRTHHFGHQQQKFNNLLIKYRLI
jgi:DNA-directed RNA polymerase specialized sigma24 family protein